MTTARFIYDFPEKNADLYYAIRFCAPDSLIYFEIDGKKFLVLYDLEVDRAKKESKVDQVLSIKVYSERAAKKNPSPKFTDVLDEIFKEQGITKLIVHEATSFLIVDELRKNGYEIEAGSSPFYPERFIKNKEEVKFITDAQKKVFASIAMARDVLKKSRIKGRRLFYRGKVLTAESLRTMINLFLMERGMIATEMPIVSCGVYAIDPHASGQGPLLPNEAIIVDIFPKSLDTLYFGDATRTFCKGRASDALKKMYATVKEAQETAIGWVKAGENGKVIHKKVLDLFESKGYHTGLKDGRNEGFIHGTGHSIGLEIHEEPARMRYHDYILREGNVMSVEPGLYYKGIGGVRIEDLVYIKKGGCDILSKFPKQLEV